MEAYHLRPAGLYPLDRYVTSSAAFHNAINLYRPIEIKVQSSQCSMYLKKIIMLPSENVARVYIYIL